MSRAKSWGFPRWGGYGSETKPEAVRTCDMEHCSEPGEHPAPKSRYSKEKWWFCQRHAGDYNRAWNYFDGMSYEEMKRAAEEETRTNAGYAKASSWTWMDDDGTATPEERRAFAVLGLETNAEEAEIKARFRELAKKHHPDANPDDPEATIRFQQVSQAYKILASRREKA